MPRLRKQRRTARRELALSARWSAPVARPSHLVKLTQRGATVDSVPAWSLEEADRLATRMRDRAPGLGYDVMVTARPAVRS